MKHLLIQLSVFLILSLFILIPFGYLARVPINGQVAFFLIEPAFVLLTFFLFILFKKKQNLLHDRCIQVSAAFIVFSVFSLIMNSWNYVLYSTAVGFLYLARITPILLFTPVAFSVIKINLIKRRRELMIGVVVSAHLIILFSLIQYFLYPELRNIMYLGWDPHLYRMLGLYFDPPIAGVVYILFALFFYLSGQFKHIYFKYVLPCIFLLMTLLTYSRITYIAAGVILSFILLSEKRYRILAGIAVLFLVVLFLLPRQFGEGVNLLRTKTIQARVEDYQEGWKVFASNPIFGAGYGRLRYYREQTTRLRDEGLAESHAGASFHSSYMTLLASTGVIGLILFTFSLYLLSRKSKYLTYGVSFLAVAAIGDNVLLHPIPMILLLLLAAVDQLSLS